MNNMDKIRVVVVDDEPRCVLRLVEDLSAYGDFELLATCHSSESAIDLVQKMQPDVLFLDVEMPQKTGFEVLQELRGKVAENMMVVFYTAFDKYMIDALRASAFDFLLKPYQPEELEQVVSRIRERMQDIREDMLGVGTPGLSDSLSTFGNLVSRRAAIQTIDGLVLVNPSDVFSFTFCAESKIWLLKMVNGTEHKLKKQTTARHILAISESFVQVRQDVIVNLDFLMGIENYTLRCIFAPPFDQEDIQVSRRCYKNVRDKLDIL